MNPPTDIETRLRASLSEHAAQAPPASHLAERILVEVDAPPVLRPRHGWRTWTFPLLAAAAIAAVALTVSGVSTAHHSATHNPPGTHGGSPVPSGHVSTSPDVTPTSPSPTPTTRVAPHAGFTASDVTFVGTTDGWALGSGDCVAHATRCTTILRTTDGTHWSRIEGTANFVLSGAVGCSRACVGHIRFATTSIGYAYGPDALFMTIDGGAHWTRQAGLGADALETLSGNVLLARVINSCQGCPQFVRAPIGTSSWTPFSLPDFSAAAVRIDLARAGHSALLAPISYNPAKPPGDAPVVYRSSNDGATWAKTATACPNIGIGYTEYVTAATMASDGSMAIACATTTATNLTGYGSTVYSTNGGETFSAPPHGGKLSPADIIASPWKDVQLVVVNDGTVYRSTDTGDSWSPVPELRGVTFLGFESSSLGRAIGDGGRTIWTTHNGGATWTGGAFSR